MSKFAFFPYFPTDNIDQKTNRVHLFNFAEFGETYIPNDELRKRIDEYCALYIDSKNRRLTTLTIAVIDGNYEFDNITEEQEEDLYRYSAALLFCSVIKNTTNSVCVSEQFNLAIQPFVIHGNEVPQYDYISSETGSLLRTLNAQTLGTAEFVRPSFVPASTWFYNYDSLLFDSFSKMIDAHNSDDARYFRVLDWVRYAHLNPDGYSSESRFVMLATAFEILFDLPRDYKTDEFAKRLEKLLEVDSMTVVDENYNTIQVGLPQTTKSYTTRGGKVKFRQHTMYGWWARDFYDLRSKIVHGEDINNQDIRNHKGEQHFFIALKILRFCFYKFLENKGYLTFKKLTEIPSLENYSFEKSHTENELREIEQLLD